MRKTVTITAIVAVFTAGLPATPGFAQAPLIQARTAPVDKAAYVSSVINSFPSGGQALRSQISDMVVKDPDLAADVARYLQSNPGLSEAQRQAVEGGLADALNRLGILAQAPQVMGPILTLLAVGGAVGLAALVANSNKSDTKVSGN